MAISELACKFGDLANAGQDVKSIEPPWPSAKSTEPTTSRVCATCCVDFSIALNFEVSFYQSFKTFFKTFFIRGF